MISRGISVDEFIDMTILESFLVPLTLNSSFSSGSSIERNKGLESCNTIDLECRLKLYLFY